MPLVENNEKTINAIIEKKANKVPVRLIKAKRFSLETKFSVNALSLKALIISFEFSPARIIINTAKPV